MTRGMVIQKEPFIDNWCEPDMTNKNNVLSSDKGSYNDDIIQNPDSGLDNGKKHTNNCISVSKRYPELSCLKYALCEPPICL